MLVTTLSSVFSVNNGCIRGAAVLKGRLKSVHDYKCRKCTRVNNEPLEVVNKSCYLGDLISVGGGVEESIVTRI